MNYLLPPDACPYEQVVVRREVATEAQLRLKEALDALMARPESLSREIEAAGLQGVLSDLDSELDVLESRRCEHCGGAGGGHVFRSCERSG